MSSPAIKPNWIRRLSLAAVTLLLTACQDSLARRDTMAFHAGESVAYNKAVHVIDPWPAGSARTDIEHDGRRLARVIERYESGGAAAPSGPPSALIAVPMPTSPAQAP